MDITITSRHEKASASLQETITTEFSKLEKFYDRITSCHIIIDSERGMDSIEVVVNMAGHTITATAKAENVGKAIDEALSKTERQIKKINEMTKDHKFKPENE